MTFLRRRLSLISIGVLIAIVLIAAAAAFFRLDAVRGSTANPPSIALNDLARRIRSGQIAAIEVTGFRAFATTRDGERYVFQKEIGATVPDLLAGFGVTSADLIGIDYQITEPTTSVNWLGLLSTGALLIVLAATLYFVVRQTQRSSRQVAVFGKSRAKLAPRDGSGKRFEDVAGVEEAKQELTELVEFLKAPERFQTFGARIPRGVLLVGPPGTGKTLLARAVAGEADVPFFSLSGSEFVELYVGVGAARVRDLFAQARKQSPCIIFIDEIDAVGRRRGNGHGASHEEREQTLNQILVEMDGFEATNSVIVIAATNRSDVLDPALLRPGRFDRQVYVPTPDVKGRRAILEVHARGKPIDPAIDLDSIAKSTPGFSGADLANLVNEAAILAVRRAQPAIGHGDLEEAIDRVIGGPERKSRVMSDREKRLTAYHEAGHAVVGRYLDNHDPLHKITIIPRGQMGGYTRFLPPEDRSYLTRGQLTDMLASALGGHAAETIVFGEMSTGAGNDIEKATAIARKMVTEYGMSDRLGPIALGRTEGDGATVSPKLAEAIDEEVHRLIDAAHGRAHALLERHRATLDRLAEELIQVETVEGPEIDRIFAADPVAAAPAAPTR